MVLLPELADVLSILMSIFCGSLIGFEREYHNKSAGFRTMILICLGSTIFTIVSKHGAGSDDRIAANIITGIGFIGGGVIFKDKLSVLGLTTAAVIWTSAGIGMAAGIGYHSLAFTLTICTLIILSILQKIELIADRLHHSRTINITFEDADIENIYFVEELLQSKKMKSKRLMLNKNSGRLFAILKITGSQRQFAEMNEELIKLERVKDYH